LSEAAILARFVGQVVAGARRTALACARLAFVLGDASVVGPKRARETTIVVVGAVADG